MELKVDKLQLLALIKIFMPIYWLPKMGSWWRDLYLERLNYRLEQDYAICESGVFFYSKKRVPYSAIREVSVYRGPILQLLGASYVKVQTSGQNQGYPEITYLCLENPEDIVQEISRRITEARGS